MAEYSEAKGGAWIEGKVGRSTKWSRRNATRRKWNRLRSGVSAKKKPRVMIPLGPPPSTVEIGGEDAQLGQVQYLDGSLGTQLYQRWLFVMTPEKLVMEDLNVSPLYAATNEGDTVAADKDPGSQIDDVVRIIGMRGSVYWTPQTPLGEPASLSPENFTGKWGYAWTVQRATGTTSADGTPAYLFGNYDEATSANGIAGRGLMPVQGVGAYLGNLANIDWRLSQAKMSILKYGMGRWRIPAEYTTAFDSSGAITEQRLLPLPPSSYRIPVPRKLCVDVGKGKALCLIIWYRDDNPSGEVGGAPAARLDYHDFRVIGHVLD